MFLFFFFCQQLLLEILLRSKNDKCYCSLFQVNTWTANTLLYSGMLPNAWFIQYTYVEIYIYIYMCVYIFQSRLLSFVFLSPNGCVECTTRQTDLKRKTITNKAEPRVSRVFRALLTFFNSQCRLFEYHRFIIKVYWPLLITVTVVKWKCHLAYLVSYTVQFWRAIKERERERKRKRRVL